MEGLLQDAPKQLAPASECLPIEILDSDGDVDLYVEKKGKIRVSSKLLALHSPVLHRLLYGSFREAVDFANSTGKIYELNLPEDYYHGMLTLCKVFYHRQELPPNLEPVISYPGRMDYSAHDAQQAAVLKAQNKSRTFEYEMYKKSLQFRDFVLTCDKYQSTPVCSLYISSWLDSLMSHCEGAKWNNRPTPLAPFTIAECAVILRATGLYRRATKWIIQYTYANEQGTGFAYDIGSEHSLLPATFENEIMSAKAAYLGQISKETNRIVGHLSKVAALSLPYFDEKYLLSSEAELPSRPMHGHTDGDIPASNIDDDEGGYSWTTDYTPGLHDIALLTDFMGQMVALGVGSFAIKFRSLEENLQAVSCLAFWPAWQAMNSSDHADSCNACHIKIEEEVYKIFETIRGQIDGLEPPYWE
ncbi:hypothetical protein BT63DRAFT_426363 [Microthyrium microscopicum]|uniref:BTB domain-containing protein n=1 Tax=Microthyrium microscopicum TaxID=703497 RepID=A0A6A6U7D6_9PEZI|nr:hypothetical protein BT63DRAFT_426363 [Microthyrium microscopicum]